MKLCCLLSNCIESLDIELSSKSSTIYVIVKMLTYFQKSSVFSIFQGNVQRNYFIFLFFLLLIFWFCTYLCIATIFFWDFMSFIVETMIWIKVSEHTRCMKNQIRNFVYFSCVCCIHHTSSAHDDDCSCCPNRLWCENRPLMKAATWTMSLVCSRKCKSSHNTDWDHYSHGLNNCHS